jgi:Zn-dependent protease with chaperone function
MDIIRDTVTWTFEHFRLTDESRQTLRAWTPLLGIVAGLIPFVWITLITGWSAARTRSLPWWEEARGVYPMRVSIASAPGVAVLPGFFVIMVEGRGSSITGVAGGITMAILGWMTAGFIHHLMEARLTARRFNAGKTVAALAPAFLLYGVATTILLVVTTLGGREWSWKLVPSVTGGLFLLYVWFNYCLPPIMWRLTDDPPDFLLAAVHEAVPPGGTMPPVRVLRSDSVNALAMLRHGWIAFTRGAVERLTAEDLTRIARHELAHLSEPAADLRKRQRALLNLTPVLLISPLMNTFGISGLLITAAGCLVISRLLGGSHSQRLENRADAAASEEDAGAYARTLERIYELNLIPAVMGIPGQSHPDLYERMLAAGVTPSFPRPAPPAHWMGRLARLLNFVTLFAGSLVLMTLRGLR